MKRKIIYGLLFGAAAGVIDVLPMIIQKLTWDADLSAFFMWVVVGFLIATTELKLKGFLKGILLAFLVLIPVGILIGWHNPLALLPICIMTLLLGGVLGFSLDKFQV